MICKYCLEKEPCIFKLSDSHCYSGPSTDSTENGTDPRAPLSLMFLHSSAALDDSEFRAKTSFAPTSFTGGSLQAEQYQGSAGCNCIRKNL